MPSDSIGTCGTALMSLVFPSVIVRKVGIYVYWFFWTLSLGIITEREERYVKQLAVFTRITNRSGKACS
jgi:hypothetical protein